MITCHVVVILGDTMVQLIYISVIIIMFYYFYYRINVLYHMNKGMMQIIILLYIIE